MTHSTTPNSQANDPRPKPDRPKPDRIEPAAPPEHPITPSPTEDPASQPLEVPGSPGGDEDHPGRGPDEIPSQAPPQPRQV